MALPSSAGNEPAAGQARMVAQVEYHGNSKSGVFHRPGCRNYNCKNCIVVFQSREQAIQAGFRPCKVSTPEGRKKGRTPGGPAL